MTEPTTPAAGSNADYPDQHVVEVSSAQVDGMLTPAEHISHNFASPPPNIKDKP